MEETKEQRDARDKEYAEWVKEEFSIGRGTYSPERICGRIRVKGHKASREKVKRVMDQSGLYSIHI